VDRDTVNVSSVTATTVRVAHQPSRQAAEQRAVTVGRQSKESVADESHARKNSFDGSQQVPLGARFKNVADCA